MADSDDNIVELILRVNADNVSPDVKKAIQQAQQEADKNPVNIAANTGSSTAGPSASTIEKLAKLRAKEVAQGSTADKDAQRAQRAQDRALQNQATREASQRLREARQPPMQHVADFRAQQKADAAALKQQAKNQPEQHLADWKAQQKADALELKRQVANPPGQHVEDFRAQQREMERQAKLAKAEEVKALRQQAANPMDQHLRDRTAYEQTQAQRWLDTEKNRKTQEKADAAAVKQQPRMEQHVADFRAHQKRVPEGETVYMSQWQADRALKQLTRTQEDAKKKVQQLGDTAKKTGGGVQTLATTLGTVASSFTGVSLSVAGAAYLTKGMVDYYQHTAAVANPNLAATAEISQKLYDATAGAERGDYLRYKAALAQQHARNPNKPGVAEFEAISNVTGDFPKWLAFQLSSQKELDKFLKENPTLKSFAGLPQSQQFAGMAEWHAAITQENMNMGPAERELWRKQLNETMKDWNGERAAAADAREEQAKKIATGVAAQEQRPDLEQPSLFGPAGEAAVLAGKKVMNEAANAWYNIRNATGGGYDEIPPPFPEAGRMRGISPEAFTGGGGGPVFGPMPQQSIPDKDKMLPDIQTQPGTSTPLDGKIDELITAINNQALVIAAGVGKAVTGM